MKKFLLLAIPLAFVLNTTFVQADDDDHAGGDKNGESSGKRRSTQDNQVKDTTLTMINELFPGTKSRDNKEFYEKKLFNSKKLADAVNQVKVPSKEKVESEKAVASAIGDLMTTLDTDSFKASWKKLLAESKKYEKPGNDISQEEALTKRLKIAFQNWGKAKKEISKDDEMYPFYLAWVGENGKGGEKKVSEDFKKELLDIIDKGAKGTDADKAAAAKKLLGDPSKDVNDPANKWALAKDALKHIPKGLEAELPKVLAQKELGGIVMKNAEGKAILVKLPPDANMAKAFSAPELKNWSLVGPTNGEFPKNFDATFTWGNGKWGKQEAALPTAVTQNGQQAVSPEPKTTPAAAPAKPPSTENGKTSASNKPQDNEVKSSELPPSIVAKITGKKCNSCHHKDLTFSDGKIMNAGNPASLASFEQMVSEGQATSLKPEEIEALKKFLK